MGVARSQREGKNPRPPLRGGVAGSGSTRRPRDCRGCRSIGGSPPASVADLGRQILDNVGALRTYEQKRYYADRQTERQYPNFFSPALIPTQRQSKLQRSWCRFVDDLDERGYFDRAAGDQCADGQTQDGHNLKMQEIILELCGVNEEWPYSEGMFADRLEGVDAESFFSSLRCSTTL